MTVTAIIIIPTFSLLLLLQVTFVFLLKLWWTKTPRPLSVFFMWCCLILLEIQVVVAKRNTPECMLWCVISHCEILQCTFPTAQFSHYNVCCFTMQLIPANPKIRVYEICYIHSLHRNEQLQNTVRATNSHILWNAVSTTTVSPWRNLSATQLRSAVERSEPNPSLRRSEPHSRPGMRLVLSRSLTFARSLSEQNFPGESPFGRSQSSA